MAIPDKMALRFDTKSRVIIEEKLKDYTGSKNKLVNELIQAGAEAEQDSGEAYILDNG
ncbi:MAG: hypothetical protein HUJ62_04625, partial [Streptococcus gallolyticus]|nr:hypothetical protein [Streptococcus gallolyticus]